jgi:nucleotide-binding universal stress UspA family protein
MRLRIAGATILVDIPIGGEQHDRRRCRRLRIVGRRDSLGHRRGAAPQDERRRDLRLAVADRDRAALHPDALEGHAREIVEGAVAETGGPPADVEIECRAVEGSPTAALVAASRGAEMLVLGSRGYGGFHGLLLGSVGQQCVQHAVCPVVIVRPARDGTSEGSTT